MIGGDALPAGAARHVRASDVVIAADSGYDHALAAGLRPRILVGDLDSISPAGRAHARDAAVDIDVHPADKDATDTELAVDRALAAVGDGGSLLLVGGGGDRFDHLLATVGGLARPSVAAFGTVAVWFGPTLVHVLHGPRTVRLGQPPRDITISLLPLGGDVVGVTTTGLRWPLRHETLPRGTSRGVSNLTDGGPVAVGIDRGVLAVVIPEAATLPDAARTSGAPDVATDPTPHRQEPT